MSFFLGVLIRLFCLYLAIIFVLQFAQATVQYLPHAAGFLAGMSGLVFAAGAARGAIAQGSAGIFPYGWLWVCNVWRCIFRVWMAIARFIFSFFLRIF